MNNKEIMMTSIFYLLEEARYERASNYILREVFGEDLRSMQPNEMNLIQNGLMTEIRQRYESTRGEYPDNMTFEQIREIVAPLYMCCQHYRYYGVIQSS